MTASGGRLVPTTEGEPPRTPGRRALCGSELCIRPGLIHAPRGAGGAHGDALSPPREFPASRHRCGEARTLLHREGPQTTPATSPGATVPTEKEREGHERRRGPRSPRHRLTASAGPASGRVADASLAPLTSRRLRALRPPHRGLASCCSMPLQARVRPALSRAAASRSFCEGSVRRTPRAEPPADRARQRPSECFKRGTRLEVLGLP